MERTFALNLERGGKKHWFMGARNSLSFSLLLADDIGLERHKPRTVIFLLLAEDIGLGRHKLRRAVLQRGS